MGLTVVPRHNVKTQAAKATIDIAEAIVDTTARIIDSVNTTAKDFLRRVTDLPVSIARLTYHSSPDPDLIYKEKQPPVISSEVYPLSEKIGIRFEIGNGMVGLGVSVFY